MSAVSGLKGVQNKDAFHPLWNVPGPRLPCAIQPQLSAPKNHTPFRPANQFPDKQREDEEVDEEEEEKGW